MWMLAGIALVAAAIVAGELVSRWWIRRKGDYFVMPPGLRMKVCPDPDIYPDLERTAMFEVNSDGERGEETPRRDPGLYRILVGGGSQAEGLFLDQQTTWPGALQRTLETPDTLVRLGASKVHVGCVARSGVGAEALDLMFERMLPRYPRLQLIITLVGVTDLMRWLEQGTPSTLEPVRTTDLFRCHPEGPFGWMPRETAVWELLRRKRRRWLRPLDVHERAGKWLRKAQAMRAQATNVIHDTPDPSPMLDHFERHFRRVLLRARAHSDRVIVIRQPWLHKQLRPEEDAQLWHGGRGQAWREEVTTYYSYDVFTKLMWLLDARAATVARALDVEQLDLMPMLEPTLTTFYDGLHLTPAGSKVVTDAITAAVLRQPIPRTQTVRGDVRTDGRHRRAALQAS